MASMDSLVWKNNTPEKAVALFGFNKQRTAAINKTKLCVDATGAILWLAKQRNERHIEPHVCTRRRHGGRSGLEKQRNGRHI